MCESSGNNSCARAISFFALVSFSVLAYAFALVTNARAFSPFIFNASDAALTASASLSITK
jgi:hypothetical protein